MSQRESLYMTLSMKLHYKCKCLVAVVDRANKVHITKRKVHKDSMSVFI